MVNEAELTQHLALAICMQLSSDYDDLMRRLKIKEKLKWDTYQTCASTQHRKLAFDRNGANLRAAIIRQYIFYADFLKRYKYEWEETQD